MAEEDPFANLFDEEVELTVKIYADEEIEIEVERGDLPSHLVGELEGVLADLMALLDYESHTYNVQKFLNEVNDWLYYRTGDEMFHDQKREKDERLAKIQAKKDEEARKKAAEEAQRKQQEEFRKKNRAKFANMLGSMDYTAKMTLLRAAQREQEKRRQLSNIQVVSEQQDAAQNQAQVELYVKRRLEAPDKARFGGPDNHYLLDNLEIAFALQSAIFTHTFKHTKEIPRIIGQLEYLQELNLGYNDLISVPTEITELHQLRRLILCENKLVMLPMLGTLQNLVSIDCRKNNLTDIPMDICDLPNLQSIDFEHNKIRRIPTDINKCSKLDFISFDHNRITLVPPQVGQLDRLDHLRLRWNPIKNIPPEIFHQGLEKTMAFLKQYVPENAVVEDSDIRMRVLRQLDVPDYSDVVIRTGQGANIYAHKLVFYTRCRPLYNEIEDRVMHAREANFETDPSGRIVFTIEEPTDVVKLFLEYLYSDGITWETIPDAVTDVDPETGKRRAKEVMQKLEEERRIVIDTRNKRYETLANLASKYQVTRLEKIAQFSRQPPASTITQDFKQMLFSKDLSDIAFDVEGTVIRAHKLLVVAGSTYFASMLGSGLIESQLDVIPINDMSVEVARAVFEFCYSDDVEDITSEIAIDLMITATLLSLPRLRGILESVVGYALDVDNAASIYDVADLYSCRRLRKAAKFFMLGNWSSVSRTEAFLMMKPENREYLTKTALAWELA